MKWFEINEKLKQLEQEELFLKDDEILYKEWRERWNALIVLASKTAGCLKRKKK